MEIAELVSDPDFRQWIRRMMVFGMQRDADDQAQVEDEWIRENAVAAVLRGCPPESAEAAQVVERILQAPGGRLRREGLLAGLEVVTDRRLDRYWQLTALINEWPPFPTYTPAHEWLIAALRAHEQPAGGGGAAIPPWVARVQERDEAAGGGGISP